MPDLQSPIFSNSYSSHEDIRVIPAAEYQTVFAESIDATRHRLGMQAMVMTLDAETGQVFDAASRALQRKVEASILPDTYSRLFDDNFWKYQWWSHEGREAGQHIRRLQHRLGELSSQGANVAFTRPYRWPAKLNPFAGRSHIKANVFDDIVDIGGINLSDRYFRATDYMLRIYDKGSADFVYEYQVEHALSNVNARRASLSHDIDNLTQLIIDVGQPKRSSIYDRVIETVTHASSLVLLTQYQPKGRLLNALTNAQQERGINHIQIYTNRWDQFAMPGAALRRIEMDASSHLKVKRPLTDQFIHAKLLLATLHDGSKVCVGGSHNFQENLVNLGTAEIALYSTDPAVFERLSSYVESTGLVSYTA